MKAVFSGLVSERLLCMLLVFMITCIFFQVSAIKSSFKPDDELFRKSNTHCCHNKLAHGWFTRVMDQSAQLSTSQTWGQTGKLRHNIKEECHNVCSVSLLRTPACLQKTSIITSFSDGFDPMEPMLLWYTVRGSGSPVHDHDSFIVPFSDE